ncbi:MAG: AMP-binding protein [Candidatus Moranbacteria bacterium]|nr:AMP-binding protein [Candidatus Moranbacteria bacterium]
MEKSSIYQCFREIADRYGSKQALLFKHKQNWKSITYKKLLLLVDNFSQNLSEIGVNPGDKAAILSENRPEWLISDLALNKSGAISVPIHITSSKDDIQYIINDSKSKYLIVSSSILRDNPELLEADDFKKIIVFNLNKFKKSLKKQKNFEKWLKNKEFLKNFAVLAKTRPNQPSSKLNYKPNTNDVTSIVYTSGTTGKPKGVMLTNKNFISNVSAVTQVIKIRPDDLFYSFLPLSHVLERTAGSYSAILSGASIAYSSSIKKLSAELPQINPTILISVPKIFEKIFEKISQNLKTSGDLKKKMFFWALRKKNKAYQNFIAEKLILNRIKKKIFGKNLRFAVSGGASISKSIIKFFDGLSVAIIEGYGLTETAPIITVNPLKGRKLGSVGKPIKNVEIKTSKNKEILVKGSNVFGGYWQKENLNKEVFTQNGWFKTGDLGFIDNENYLTIIGRKKDIIVTSNGKNIAPNKIECLINLSPLVSHSIVIGHQRKYLSALISPNVAIKKSDNLKMKEYEELINKEIAKINKKLSHFERIKKIKVINNPFSIEKGELTPTLKIRRKIIEARYKKVIEKMYQEF